MYAAVSCDRAAHVLGDDFDRSRKRFADLVSSKGDALPHGLSCFTDGSFTAVGPEGRPQRGWSCIFFDKSRRTCDVLAGVVPDWYLEQYEAQSAFCAECWALVVALWVGVSCFRDAPIQIFSDCQSAIAVANGEVALRVAGVAQILGCIGNELADLAAKSAAEGHLLGDISWTVPQEQDDAGCFLHSVLRKCNLWAPATWDYVQQGPTWTYAQRRNGALNRPEFVLLPQEWQQGNVSSWTDASITAANMVIDHLATVVDVCITLYVGPGPQRTARIAIDVKALTDPANRTDLAQIIEDAPRPSWQVSAHSHVAQVTAYLQKSLSERFPRVRQAPVHPYLSDMAWDLHQQVSRLRRRLTAVKTAVRRQTFAGILEAWRCVARSKADRAQYLEKLADDIQDTAPQLQLGGRKGGSVIVGSHVMRTYMRIRKAQNRPSSVLFADVSAAYYSTVRCLAARRPSEEPSGDALEATLARMDPLSAEDQLEVPSAMAQQGADPWLRALTCVKNSDTWMVLRSGDVAVKTHRGTRPGSAWADLTFGVLVRRILRVRDGCRRARTGTSSSAQVSWDGRRHWGPAEEETHIVSLEDIVWADDVASCLDTVDAAGTASHVGFEDCEAWYDFMRLHPVPSWFRVEVADAPAGRKEVADDVLLMLDPELICDSFCRRKSNCNFAPCCEDLPGPFQTSLSFILSGRLVQFTLEDAPCPEFCYSFKGGVPLAAAKRQTDFLEAACDVVGSMIQHSLSTRVALVATRRTLASIEPLPTWLLSVGFSSVANGLCSPDD
ncbi:unnamed protein product [Symbiodinium microadriaticum]|nr:unnamed protein product [Symbiodinium microadriaticum]